MFARLSRVLATALVAPLLLHCAEDDVTTTTDAGPAEVVVSATAPGTATLPAQGDAGTATQTPNPDATETGASSETPRPLFDGGTQGGVVRSKLGAKGGSVATEDLSARLVVPFDALQMLTPVSVEAVDPPPDGALVAVKIGPGSLTFAVGATLTISFAKLELGDIDPVRLQLARFEDGQWRIQEDAILSLQARNFSVVTFAAGTFGVLVGPVPEMPEPPSTETLPSENPPVSPAPDAGCNAQDCCAAACNVDASVPVPTAPAPSADPEPSNDAGVEVLDAATP